MRLLPLSAAALHIFFCKFNVLTTSGSRKVNFCLFVTLYVFLPLEEYMQYWSCCHFVNNRGSLGLKKKKKLNQLFTSITVTTLLLRQAQLTTIPNPVVKVDPCFITQSPVLAIHFVLPIMTNNSTVFCLSNKLKNPWSVRSKLSLWYLLTLVLISH